MARKTTTDTPINVNPVNVGTKQDNNVRPTGNQHTTNRAMAGVKAHTLVGPSARMLDPYIKLCMPLLIAVYTLMDEHADVCLWSHGATFFTKLIIFTLLRSNST